jgi:enoyl-CoA hydratase/carnithine racemase
VSGVRVEERDRTALITIDRPERRNAIDLPAAKALAAAFDELDSRDDLAVGVLTGAGTSFSAGMDLKALGAGGERPHTDSRGMFGIVERPPRKPLIAAVEGAALGGGFEIALACDLIVAAEDAIFGLPEVKRGLVASAGGVIRLPKRIPSAIALELVLTGEPLKASRARELGLINRVCDSGRAREVALELAAQIAQNAPLAILAAKQILHEAVELSIQDAFARQQPTVQLVRESEDAREGTLAFIEKRLPVWRGR